MKKLSILGKLLIAAVPLVLVGIVSMILLSSEVNSALSDSEKIFYEQLYTVDDLVITADRDLYQARLAQEQYMRSLVYSDRSAKQVDYPAEFAENAQQTVDGVNAVKAIIAKYPEVGSFKAEGKDINSCIKEFESYYAAWFDLADPATTSPGKYSQSLEYYDMVRDPINSMGDIVSIFADTEKEMLVSSTHKALGTIIIISIIIYVIVIVFALYVISYIKRNTVYITEKIESIAQNDLTDEIRPLEGSDELCKLNKSARDVQTHLREMIGMLQGSSVALADSSNQMGHSTQETSGSIASINNAASELANTATSQATDIADIANHMTTVDEMMQRNTENANALAEISHQILRVTDEGLSRVDGLKNITDQSVAAFEEIFEVIGGIEESTKKISEASDLISSIAGQTNLLSLNASIEAARAGDAGRGFAVVADEIRQLSEQSANSVNVINEMLSDLQSNTDNAAKRSDNVRGYVSRQKEAVEETSQSFTDIANGIQSINSTVDALHSANENLGEGVANISGLIENLSAISEENAATAQELNATTDTVNNSVVVLAENGDNVSKSAMDLERIISEFKVDPMDIAMDKE